MGFYSKYILPKVVHLACTSKPNMKQRQKVVPLAGGRVLEIGAGSGLNLPFYDAAKVEHLFALEPSEEMWAMADERQSATNFSVEFMPASAQEIPLEPASVDTVVVTYTLCTIPEAVHALEEMRRVLRKDGQLIFCEHGLAPDVNIRKWQGRINPTWKRLGGGCNLNRDIPKMLTDGGFKINDLKSMYIPGLKPMSFNYWGVAKL